MAASQTSRIVREGCAQPPCSAASLPGCHHHQPTRQLNNKPTPQPSRAARAGTTRCSKSKRSGPRPVSVGLKGKGVLPQAWCRWRRTRVGTVVSGCKGQCGLSYDSDVSGGARRRAGSALAWPCRREVAGLGKRQRGEGSAAAHVGCLLGRACLDDVRSLTRLCFLFFEMPARAWVRPSTSLVCDTAISRPRSDKAVAHIGTSLGNLPRL